MQSLFTQVLLTCDRLGLIGKEMFAIDGVKLPANASKERSGTHVELAHRADRLDKAARKIIQAHQRQDAGGDDSGLDERRAQRVPELLRCNEQRVYGDSAYASQRALIESKAPRAKDFTNQRVRRGGEIDEAARSKNHNKSRVRARVEHVFAMVKRLWGFAKVRYRGLAKNATRSFVVLGLANIYLARKRFAA